jgi:hypothetical protein
MKRRSLLAAVGIGLSTAGCLSQADDSSDMSSPNTDENTTGTRGRQTPGTTPSHHGPDSTPSDQPGNAECPSFAEDVERTVCWSTDDTGAEPIYLTASSKTFEPSPGGGLVEHIKFTLHNDSSQTFGLNPHAWAIKRQITHGWEHVAPEIILTDRGIDRCRAG